MLMGSSLLLKCKGYLLVHWNTFIVLGTLWNIVRWIRIPLNKAPSVLYIGQGKVHPSSVLQSIWQCLLLLRSLISIVRYQNDFLMTWRVGKLLLSIPEIILVSWLTNQVIIARGFPSSLGFPMQWTAWNSTLFAPSILTATITLRRISLQFSFWCLGTLRRRMFTLLV